MCIGVFVQVNESSKRGKSDPIGYVIQENGCWEWAGAMTLSGYGTWNNGGDQRAHRVMYKRHKGPIPEGLVLDHLCRNKACVNPDHLEAVDDRTNLLRGVGRCAQNARKTHCLRGHEFTEANTYRQKNNGRVCRACQCLAQREYMARKRAGRVRPRQ